MSASKAKKQRQRAEEIRAQIREIAGRYPDSRIASERVQRLEAELRKLRFKD